MFTKIILFNLLLYIISCRKYPLFEKLKKSKKDRPKSLYLKSSEDYNNYLNKNNYIITYISSDYCEECRETSSLIEEASKYQMINRKWLFLKIDCSMYYEICQYLNIEEIPANGMYKIYIKKEIIDIQIPTELDPLLELLYKLSSNPIIKINSKDEFFSKYGYYNPIVEIKKNEDKKDIKIGKELIECIEKVAHDNFLQIFYFGVIESKDNKERIIFDNGNYPFTYIWDGVCQNATNFLNKNKYPLLSNVDKYLLKELDEDSEPHILITLISFPKNKKVKNFISKAFKNLAYEERQYLFGYIDYDEDKSAFEDDFSFNVKLNSTNQIQLIINDFMYRSYYIHKSVFDIDIQTDKDIINEIENLLLNITNLKFETGSLFQDFVNFIGFNRMSSNKQVILISTIILLSLVFAYRNGESNENLDDDKYDYEEGEEEDTKYTNNKLTEVIVINKKKSNKK